MVTSGGYSETASWGDYDNDGLLDLYVTRSGATTLLRRNQLYHNDGGNAFTKITVNRQLYRRLCRAALTGLILTAMATSTCSLPMKVAVPTMKTCIAMMVVELSQPLQLEALSTTAAAP
jgi:hypothetical protein